MGRLKALKPRVKTLVKVSMPTVATARLRGQAAVDQRARRLRASPLCAHCHERSITTAATVVDHIVPLTLGGPDTDLNTQNLCDDCHQAKSLIDGSRPSSGASI